MDYQRIIDSLTPSSIIQLMKKLGVDNYIEKEDCIIFPTICHNEDIENASMKLYWYKNNKIFYCYTEDGAQSIFKFLKNYYETRNIEYDWYSDIYLVIQNITNFTFEGFTEKQYESLKSKYQKINKNITLNEYPKSYLNCFIEYDPPEWQAEGMTHEALRKFDIRYSISQNKIIIPHLDLNGRLVGIRGRALNEEEIEIVGKYMPVKVENTWCTHKLSMNLYGFYQNIETIRKNKICYLFEAEKSVIQLESFGIDNCGVAVCGSNFNKYQLNLLLKNCELNEIVICFDNEELNEEDKYFNKLWKIGEKYKNYCNFSFVYDMKGLLKLKDSPTDRGKDIFLQLLKRRVEIH